MRPGRRRVLPETSLGKVLEAIEHTKARIRAKVEHPFHVVKNLFKQEGSLSRPRQERSANADTVWSGQSDAGQATIDGLSCPRCVLKKGRRAVTAQSGGVRLAEDIDLRKFAQN